MDYFKRLESILFEKSPSKKFELFKEFYTQFKEEKLNFEEHYEAVELMQPSYEGVLKIVLPKKVKMRKYFDTNEGKANLLHTVCHIEYSAVDLALDAAYRFHGLPMQYYRDWLEVAEDEIRHFQMCETLLNELGYKYGDLEVHTNLFEAMKNTKTLLSRMAVVPRFLEANGLEQNPKIMEKLNSNFDAMNQKIVEALEVILEEEITHVQKGDRWFKFACELEGCEPESTYINLLEEHFPGCTKKVLDLNFEARKQAGFSCDELKRLSNKKECQ